MKQTVHRCISEIEVTDKPSDLSNRGFRMGLELTEDQVQQVMRRAQEQCGEVSGFECSLVVEALWLSK